MSELASESSAQRGLPAADHEELRELQGSLRRFLSEKAPVASVRQWMDADTGHDPAVWAQMADQLGLPGIAVPEEFGGQGFGAVEQAVVLEELGRVLAGAPFLASAAFAGQALVMSDDAEARQRWLPGIADGSLTATVAVREDTCGWDGESLSTVAEPAAEGFTLTGTKTLVINGEIADLLLVAARAPDGPALFAVVPGDGVTQTRLAVLDPTRRLARVELAAAPAHRIAAPAGHLRAVLDCALVAVAAEQVGGAQACLDMAVEYAKVRVQFGRPIGSFQAIKHKCADMLLQLEAGRSALQHATAVVADGVGGHELSSAAAACAAWCGPAFTHIAKETIQVHGGIGYTWEHDAHLYLKRAKSSELLFGSPTEHRARLAGLVGIGAA